jgi:hypothetical protein
MESSIYLLVALLGTAFILGFWLGYKQIVCIQHLTLSRIVNTFLIAMILLTTMAVLQWVEVLSPGVASTIIMHLYCGLGGFFFGFAFKMIRLRREAKKIYYVYRSFWTEAAPNLVAILLIAFGLFRTAIFTFGPYSGISITSGISLVGFGIWGLTIRIVPEFRYRGIIILDQLILWKRVVSYHWASENILQIEYFTTANKLTDFTTYIPPDDQLQIERQLGKKLREFEEDRRKEMSEGS